MGMGMEIDITDTVRNHMEQQPYQIICSVCGGDLTVQCTIDSDLDMMLKVEPCDSCLAEAKIEGGM